jgi:hypothetical protein
MLESGEGADNMICGAWMDGFAEGFKRGKKEMRESNEEIFENVLREASHTPLINDDEARSMGRSLIVDNIRRISDEIPLLRTTKREVNHVVDIVRTAFTNGYQLAGGDLKDEDFKECMFLLHNAGSY